MCDKQADVIHLKYLPYLFFERLFLEKIGATEFPLSTVESKVNVNMFLSQSSPESQFATLICRLLSILLKWSCSNLFQYGRKMIYLFYELLPKFSILWNECSSSFFYWLYSSIFSSRGRVHFDFPSRFTETILQETKS